MRHSITLSRKGSLEEQSGGLGRSVTTLDNMAILEVIYEERVDNSGSDLLEKSLVE